MYRKDSDGWLKHTDFIVLDMICLQLAYLLAYEIRGHTTGPYETMLYRNMAIFLELADLIVIFAFDTMKSVLKRGHYVEFSVTLKHVVMVGALAVLYLFLLQQGEDYSRLTLILTFVIYAVLTYGARELWKECLYKKMKDGGERELLIVTSGDIAEEVVKNMRKNNYARYTLAGVVVVDEDWTGRSVLGVPVVASEENAPMYVCQQWIDEVLIVVSKAIGKASILSIIKAFIPVSTNCYWFISCYILLMIFSPYINRAINSMSELQHRQLLLLMSAVFLAAPTVIYYSVLGGGKNVINMLLLYFLGSYIRKYSLDERFDKKSLLKILIATTALNILLNSLISIATGGKPHIPFARDCSVFIVIEATVLMMFFMKVEFHSDFINRVAKHVFAVYLFEGALRQIVQNIVFDYSMYEGEWYWPLVNIAVALIAMVGCMSIDVLAQWMLKPFRKAALKMLGVIINISQKIFICY